MILDLLNSWEETYKKGQLTLWIFLSLKDGEKYVDEIKSFIENISNNTISCEEQSIYRSLRKYLHLEIVEYNLGVGNKGPERKYYKLTKLGINLLNQFIERNINLFYDDKIKQLLKKELK
tara:strand:+ start:276 stop:635 length:360 start_codon:yes stop_codon:yes gene_type:complete